MSKSYVVYAVSLRDSSLLSDVLGSTILEKAWNEITQKISPKFVEMFNRYSNVSVSKTQNYQLLVLAEFSKGDLWFDVSEQKETLLTIGKNFLYEALVEHFGHGSGRKIDFSLLFKVSDVPFSTSDAALSALIDEEGTFNSTLLGDTADEKSPYCDITRREFEAILNQGLLQTYLQSIVNLEHNVVVGYEVLTRGPSGSQVERADKLFGSAEHFGLTHEIELACIKQALIFLNDIPAPYFLTFNVGPELLVSRDLQTLLDQSGVKDMYGKIAFELTEHLPLEHVNQIKGKVLEMQSKGIRIFLDDTGCGFFDINTAETLKPSVVKLCISVIRRIDDGDEIKKEVIDTRSRLDELGAFTLGEGVEEEFQAEFLRKAGVHYAQGFLFDKPKPAREALKLAH